MIPESAFNLPLLLVGPAIVGALCRFAWIGPELVPRRVLPRLRISHKDSEFSGTTVQAVMVFHGLAAALVAVSVRETHAEISDVASLETSQVARGQLMNR